MLDEHQHHDLGIIRGRKGRGNHLGLTKWRDPGRKNAGNRVGEDHEHAEGCRERRGSQFLGHPFGGDDDQEFKPGASTFYDITFATTGGATRKLIINDGVGNANPLVMTNDLTVTTGTFDLGTYDSAFSIAGDLLISNGAKWAKGGLVTFNGGLTGQTFTDANIPPVANLGDITVD